MAKAETLADHLSSKAAAERRHHQNPTNVIVFTVYFAAIKDLITTHHATLAGKIVVDPSNPIAPDGKGGSKKRLREDQSSETVVARVRPEGVGLVEASGALGAESLAFGANRSPERAVYATDDPEAGRAPRPS